MSKYKRVRPGNSEKTLFQNSLWQGTFDNTGVWTTTLTVEANTITESSGGTFKCTFTNVQDSVSDSVSDSVDFDVRRTFFFFRCGNTII